jgi:3-oxoacyl-[acyl-carrier protein] reductase
MSDQPLTTALVTGGGRGIGQGIALGLAKAGMQVAVTARSADQLAETVNLAGGNTIAVAADVADPAAVRSMVREVTERLGPVDLLVNNAGTYVIPGMSAYVASKTALIRLSEQLAREAAAYGVKVFPIRPGVVRTAMAEEGRKAIPQIQKMLDDGQDVTPQVVAELVLLLASGKADALSGRLFSVNEDLEEIVRRAAEVERGDLYLLQLRRL